MVLGSPVVLMGMTVEEQQWHASFTFYVVLAAR